LNGLIGFRTAQEVAAILRATPSRIKSILGRLADSARLMTVRRDPIAIEAVQSARPVTEDPFRAARDTIGDLFDAKFYRQLNDDVRLAGIDPLQHYLEFGWREGRDPSPGFDTRYYLTQNPDVADSGENPLVHFARIGAAEGRQPMPVDFARERIVSARSPREQVKDWLRPSDPQVLGREELRERLAEFGANDADAIIISLSHDEYATVAGGVQNCIGNEAAIFAEMGWLYLHACPAQPLPNLAEKVAGASFNLILTANGRRVAGELQFSDLADELAALRRKGSRLWLVVHHLLGHAPELVAEMGRLVGPGRTIVWIHDYFTLCPNWVLLRNDVEFCHAPPVSSTACEICCYGEERRIHLNRMRAFFDALEPIVLSPSRLALDFWREHSRLRHATAAVVPPCEVGFGAHPRSVATGDKGEGPHRIAFIGSATYLKGWQVFEELARLHRGDPRYEFYELNARRRSKFAHVRHVLVDVGPKDRLGMVTALIENQIDIVLLWSLCSETFSFTTHEAIAAGAAIITRQGAGNIAAAASAIAPEQVWILENEEELFVKFASGCVRDLAAANNRQRGTLTFGGHTADYLRLAAQSALVNDV